MIKNLILLALAGALGTLARYGLSGLVAKINGPGFAWGTLTVNVVGCFLAGLLWTIFEHRYPVTGQTRLLVLVGFMGAFTTFFAFIFETGEMLQTANWLRAAGSIALQNGLGFAALFVGINLGRVA